MFRWIVLALACMADARSALLVEQRDPGLKVAEGFRVKAIAGTNLTGNITAMALGSKGRAVVAGAGFITTLIDRDGDGKVDEAKVFAEPQSAAMGLCFDGTNLFAMLRDGIWRYSDSDADGAADGPPEKFLAVNYGERGGHAMRLGPDGWVYLICGNGEEIQGEKVSSAQREEFHTGAIVRISRDGKERQTIADGFCNPRSFDFNRAGDIFTYDDDIERDFFLPWYTPTRLYHVALGQNHGWLLSGGERSWNRPEYFADSVDLLAPVGRGEPGGVAVYRHTQFPEEYRDGIFFCDSQFGKIYFCKLQKRGSTYRPRLDVFVEPGGQKLEPRDLCVTPDGSLLVAAREGVFVIEHPGERGVSLSQPTKLQEVLQAPQSLEAWSRAKWVPAARELGAEAFARAINDASLSEAERVRAVEIYVESFAAIPFDALQRAAADKLPEVRARTAWALGHQINQENQILLQRLAVDADATARRCALEAVLACEEKLNLKPFIPLLRQNLDHPDKRLHQAAARICARLPEEEWKRLWESEAAHSLRTELSLLLAALWRTNPPAREEIVWRALETIPLASRFERADALRVTTLALGDWNLKNASAEAFAGYELAMPVSEEVSTNLLPLARKLIPAADPIVDTEATRLLAMLGDDSPETVAKVERFLQGEVSPPTAFHYLAVLAKLRGAWPESLAQTVTEVARNFDSQFAGRDRPEKLNWPERLNEVLRALVAKEPKLANLLANENSAPVEKAEKATQTPISPAP